jgi:hypothetical protein
VHTDMKWTQILRRMLVEVQVLRLDVTALLLDLRFGPADGH